MSSFTKNIILSLTALLACGAAIGTAVGEELTFLASVDRTTVGLDDHLTLTVSMSGKDIGGISEPNLPTLDQFQIIATNSSSSSQFTLVNGKMTSSKTIEYIYTLRPLEVGKTTIGSATLDFKGKTYRTEPINVEVTAGSATGQQRPSTRTQAPPTPEIPQAEPGEDLFLRADFDRQKAYPGQQITITYTLYNRANLSNVQYGQVPTFTGFWTEKIYDAERLDFQQQVIGGKRYQVAVLKKLALFPTTSGEIQVEPMELICDLRLPSRDFFDFFGRTRRVKVVSKPATILVQPLPAESKPSGFSGAVGNYTLKASVDRRQVNAGEPLELTVQIKGVGNLRTLPVPQLPILDSFRTFEPEVQENISTATGKIQGTKTYRHVLIPKEQGQRRIEPIRLVYFDPASESYRTASTEPISIDVLPGEKEQYPLAVGLGREEIKVLGSDIRYIKPSAVPIEDQEDDLYRKLGFLILQSIPLLAIFTSAVLRRRRDRISQDVRYARQRRALPACRRHLRSAQKNMRPDSSAQFYGDLSKTLQEYLGDKMNLSAGGITRQQLQQELTRRGVDDQLVKEVLECLHVCDESRFAPAVGERTNLEMMLKRIRNLIGRLEKSNL